MKDIKLYENAKSQLILQERLYKPINSIQHTIVQQTASAASCIAIYDQATGCFSQLFHYGSVERDLFQDLCNENGPAHIPLLNQQPLLLSEHSTESPSAACQSRTWSAMSASVQRSDFDRTSSSGRSSSPLPWAESSSRTAR